MGCVNIVGTVCVLRVYHTGGTRAIPTWLRCCRKLFNSALFVRNHRKTCRYSSVSSRDDQAPGAFSSVESDDNNTDSHLETIQDGIDNSLEMTTLTFKAPNGTRGQSGVDTELTRRRSAGGAGHSSRHMSAKTRHNKRVELLTRIEETAAEWKDIAVGLDRILFLTLFTCMSAMLIYCAVSYISKFLQKDHHDEETGESVSSIGF